MWRADLCLICCDWHSNRIFSFVTCTWINQNEIYLQLKINSSLTYTFDCMATIKSLLYIFKTYQFVFFSCYTLLLKFSKWKFKIILQIIFLCRTRYHFSIKLISYNFAKSYFSSLTLISILRFKNKISIVSLSKKWFSTDHLSCIVFLLLWLWQKLSHHLLFTSGVLFGIVQVYNIYYPYEW